MLVRVHGTTNSCTVAERNCLAGAAVRSMSLKYDGVDVVRTLCVSAAVLQVMIALCRIFCCCCVESFV